MFMHVLLLLISEGKGVFFSATFHLCIWLYNFRSTVALSIYFNFVCTHEDSVKYFKNYMLTAIPSFRFDYENRNSKIGRFFFQYVFFLSV